MQFNLFKKKKVHPKINYSCVIDDSPVFYWQGVIFVTSLIEIAKVEPKNIYIHLVEKNSAFESFLESKGVNKVFITPWGDKKYCNKLQQLNTPQLQNADFVFLCDADIAFLEDISKKISFDKVVGKTVDFDNPTLDKLKSIFDHFDLEHPKENLDTLNVQPTFDGNFNGGLYGIPGVLVKEFGERWKSWAEKLLESDFVAQELGGKVIHIDQLSFCMALKESKSSYRKLDLTYNCPTHIENITSLASQIKSGPRALHYHSKLSPIGLLEPSGLPLVDSSIDKVNAALKKIYENELFWNFIYRVNPELGSGIGSRGEIAAYKLNILKGIGIESKASVLDIGCGDLEIIKQLDLTHYTGVDLSNEALDNAKKSHPNYSFFHLLTDVNKIEKANTVLCLDVLIHQQSKENYEQLIKLLVNNTVKRLVISGYRNSADKSHMCFFHEDLVTSLKKENIFKYVFKIGEYRGLDLIVADKGELEKQPQNPNDIENEHLVSFLNEYKEIDDELLFESVCFSRGLFGWYTKHLPRIYEYPWLLKEVGRDLNGITIADFGAGVTPLPVLLSMRGANVITVDNNEMHRTLSSINKANEWGFFDYSTIDAGVQSINESLSTNTFQEKYIDIWYSISVVEHMPAEIRRDIFSIMFNTLKSNGKLLLTVDLIKKSKALWNKSGGQQVESPADHGTLDGIVLELESLGFTNVEICVIQMPETESVDIATISADVNK
jgi:2-polyprenyl-3-methyl-5-hydroxy-6-metoxy-1,4-benzoquinol methylase